MTVYVTQTDIHAQKWKCRMKTIVRCKCKTYILRHKGTACIKSTERTNIINTDQTPLGHIWNTVPQCGCMLTQQPQSITTVRRLRSADTATCVTRRTSNIFGDRCFAAAGPRLWNSLPINLRQCRRLEQFKRLLKTFLFSAWGHGALWYFT